MPHWLFHWLGGDGGSIYDYGSALVPDLAYAGGAYLVLRHHNCHQPHCWRISRHVITDADGATHGACRRHRQHVLDRVRST